MWDLIATALRVWKLFGTFKKWSPVQLGNSSSFLPIAVVQKLYHWFDLSLNHHKTCNVQRCESLILLPKTVTGLQNYMYMYYPLPQSDFTKNNIITVHSPRDFTSKSKSEMTRLTWIFKLMCIQRLLQFNLQVATLLTCKHALYLYLQVRYVKKVACKVLITCLLTPRSYKGCLGREVFYLVLFTTILKNLWF